MLTMLKLKDWQQHVVAAVAVAGMFLIALAILAISLISANQEAVGIKAVF